LRNHNAIKKSLGILLVLAMLVALMPVVALPAPAAAAAATTSVTVTKYGPDGTTVLDQEVVSLAYMRDSMTVQGDGATHYFTQGPTFVPDNLWDPAETLNLKDKGALKGTDIKDLCDLVGGASAGDQIEVKASDNYGERFPYANVYNLSAAQGKMVLAWYTKAALDDDNGTVLYPDGAYVPDFTHGIQLNFMAGTTNTAGQHVFGHTDMQTCLQESNWHWYSSGGVNYPSTNGLYIKWINRINIYTAETPEWTLELAGGDNTGAVTYNMDQSEFENGVACSLAGHEATYNDGTNIYKGLPLYLLVGYVDDGNRHGAGAFNNALATAGYGVKVIGGDGMNYIFPSATVADNLNIIVANTMNDAALPKTAEPTKTAPYPLKLVGSALTSGKQKVGNIVKIQLVSTITPSAGSNGTISPAEAVTVDWGSSQTFTFSPATGYHVSDVLVDGLSAGTVDSYTFNNLSINHTISVSFAKDQWVLQLVGATTYYLSQTDFETIAAEHPSNTYLDNSGNTWKGTALWRLISLIDDGDAGSFNNSLVGVYSIVLTGKQLDGTDYKVTIPPPYINFAFPPQTEDLFVANRVMLAGTQDWIELPVANPANTSKLWYPLMDTGPGIASGSLRVGALYKIELTNLPPFISASAGTHGSISPSGLIMVTPGNNQSFTFTPDTNYHVSDVQVDGVSIGIAPNYTFTNVTANHTIAVFFAVDTFTINASAGPNGSIDPSGAVIVDYGANQTFTITPNTNYLVADVLVDGVSAGAVTTSTFNDVTASHTIAATFTIDTSNWTLQLIGATTNNMTKAQFEALAAAHPSNTYLDSSNNTWKGVALWRLIALVDDGDPDTFNSSAAGVYSIVLTGKNSDGTDYVVTVGPPYEGFVFQPETEDLFIANKVMLQGTTEWINLPLTNPVKPTKLWFPLMDTGSGITVGNYRVGALYKVELTNLPPVITASAGAHGSISPSGTVIITSGSSQTFTITADTGYHIADVLVDGVSVGAQSTYTFNNVTVNHTIAASFAVNPWELQLRGAQNYNVSQAEFESAVNCTTNNHATTWTDTATNEVWKGLPLWLLCGYVDDNNKHGADAFNDSLAALGYQVKVSATDGYYFTFSSTDVANNNDLIVANVLNNAPLPEGKYPLKIVGSWPVSGGQKVAKISKIELLNLPVQTWNLELKGQTTSTISKESFESAAAANPASWSNADGTWSGIAVWRLIAKVDGGDPATFNSNLAALGYNVKVTATDGYNKTFPISDFAGRDDRIITNILNGSYLPDDKYPLKLVGTDLSTGKMVSQIVSIELIDIPVLCTVTLPAGWNLLSTPVKLANDKDTLDQIFGTTISNIEIFYGWDAEQQQWVQITTQELKPLQAIFVKVKSGTTATATLYPSQDISEPPSLLLKPGRNLIGPAPAFDAEETNYFAAMPLDLALVSISQAPGGLLGYTMVISPAYNQPAWAYALGGTLADLLPFKGYWVIIENEDTYYGFSTTPVR
jgi:hypothetical protein